MMADELLNAQDLITAKKHDTFHSEVITGKADGVSTGANIDHATNAVTGQVQDTLPHVLSKVGFVPAGFDFTTGGTVTMRNQAVYFATDGNWYSWGGALPKVVAPASTPTGSGGISPSAWNVSTSAFMYRDWQGFTDALLAEADIVDNGQPDTAGASQRVNAITRLIAKRYFEVNATDFGAKFNGIQDDTLFINNALATGKTVALPQGVSIISSALKLVNSQQSLIGTGRNGGTKLIAAPSFTSSTVAGITLKAMIMHVYHDSGNAEGRVTFTDGGDISGIELYCGNGEVSSEIHGIVHKGFVNNYGYDNINIWYPKTGILGLGNGWGGSFSNFYIRGAVDECIYLDGAYAATSFRGVTLFGQRSFTAGAVPTRMLLKISNGVQASWEGGFLENALHAIEVENSLLKMTGADIELISVNIASISGASAENGVSEISNCGMFLPTTSGHGIRAINHRVICRGNTVQEWSRSGSSPFFFAPVNAGGVIAESDNDITGPSGIALPNNLIREGDTSSKINRVDTTRVDSPFINHFTNSLTGKVINFSGYASADPQGNKTFVDTNPESFVNRLDFSYRNDGTTSIGKANLIVQKVSQFGPVVDACALSLDYDEQAFYPLSDNKLSFGTASYRCSTIFAGTGTINTSDEREKTTPEKISDEALDAWGRVSLVAYKWLTSVENKGDNARDHVGVIAQHIRDAFADKGIDATKYGLLCFDSWDDIYETRDVYKDGKLTGNEKVLVKPAGDRWGVRHDQCLYFEAAYQRRRCENMEERILAIEDILLRKI